MRESRVKKSLLNVKVELIFYFVIIGLTFVSRKTFLDCLGTPFVGLTTTLRDLLGFLNLAELGIGTAIGYVLYKPIYDQNHNEINRIISVFGYIYRWIGSFILVCGIILSLFLPLIFKTVEMGFGVIYSAYYVFLITSLLGYFINYRQTLLSADQRNYVVTAYFQTANILCLIIQIIVAKITSNPYLWIFINLIFGIIQAIILNWKINKVYPWLRADVKRGKKLFKEYPQVIKYTKQLFVHKIASFAQFQTTPFITYSFTSLTTVAMYTNYSLVASQLFRLANKFLSGTEAGIGNLVAENDKPKIINVFQELTSIRYYIAGIESFGLFLLIDPFIRLWLGAEYLMDNTMLVLVIINIFILQIRGTNDQFIYAYGLFWDIFAPIIETVLSLGCAVIFGYLYGLNGVLAGMLVGTFVIVCLWKPYLLFHYGMKTSVLTYWRIIMFNIISLSLSFILTYTVSIYLMPKSIENFIIWTVVAIVSMLVYSSLSLSCFMALTKGMRLLVKRFVHKI